MPLASSRSTVPRRETPRRPGVDVYLLPAVIGGGLGDIEEVLAAGRRLARAGYRVRLYRSAGRPLPRSVAGPWAWPRLEREAGFRERAGAALTVTPAWGVSAAPPGPPPLGRPGPWAEEARAIESAYGKDRTIHVSLEEFARTLTVAEEARERYREGGIRARAIGGRLREPTARVETEAFARAFRRFRAFDRPNVLHLFATPARRPGFSRTFPAAVQTGPLWPCQYRRAPPTVPRSREWVWYASPASAVPIAPEVVRALSEIRPRLRLFVRSPWPGGPAADRPGVEWVTAPVAPDRWRRRFSRADLRIVTGSRTLLEALELGGPFLYFNGVIGAGAARRRHRPEKIVALLRALRGSGAGEDLVRDLADFARGRRVGEIVRRAASRQGGWAAPFPRVRASGFRRPFDDAGAVIEGAARALARPDATAAAVVARVRARSNA